MLKCDLEDQLNDELRSYAFDAISNLVSDSKALFRSKTERKEANNERI